MAGQTLRLHSQLSLTASQGGKRHLESTEITADSAPRENCCCPIYARV